MSYFTSEFLRNSAGQAVFIAVILNFSKLSKRRDYYLVTEKNQNTQDVVELIRVYLLLGKSLLCMCGQTLRIRHILESFLKHNGEIDYVRVLNRVLPRDIRIISWCPVPADFHARFSCLSREYKYFFWAENLNISAMQSAGKKFLGEHDFRNFCKMDAANVHNYKRNVTSFDIIPSGERWRGKEIWVIKIRGSAFLWHQVRCMVAVLFMIGQGLESEELIDVLLDIENTPKKPQYTMAPEMPLVLHSCEFRGLKLSSGADARQALCAHLENECQNLMLQAAIFNDTLNCCLYSDEGNDSFTKGISAKKYLHIPLMQRPTEPSYEERRAKLDSVALKKGTIELSIRAGAPDDG